MEEQFKKNQQGKPKKGEALVIVIAIVACIVMAIISMPNYNPGTDNNNSNIDNNTTNNSNNAMDEFAPPAGYDERYSITKEYIASSTEGIYKMKEYNGNTWFCKVSVPIIGSSVCKEVDTGNIWKPNYLYLLNTANYDDFSFKSVTKGQDQLVLVGITYASCTPIIEMDYTIPYYLGAYSGSIHYRCYIGILGGHNEDIEEINGQDPSAYLNRLSDRYNVFRADEGETFTFSYFSGTDYLEESVIADHFYYIIGDSKSEISLPVTKTKEGYFLVDYSELTPGYYCFSAGWLKETIIEIKD